MDLFDVYVLRFEVNDDRATRALMQVFGMNEGSARVFVHSVPRVGKRDVPTGMAERYVRALHAVGAIVECRRSGTATSLREAQAGANTPQLSLPAPPDAAQLGVNTPPHVMQDSLGIMAPLAYSPDMPQIPKAPRLPADLQHIRARKGPDSLAPNWRPRGTAAAPTHTPSGGAETSGSGPIGATELPSGQIGTVNAEPGLWTDPDALAAALHADPLAALRAERAEAGGDHLPREFLDSPEDDAFGGDEPEFVPAKRVASSESSAPPPAPPSKPSTPMSMSPFVAISDAPLKAAEHTEAAHDGPTTPWYATTTHQLLLAALVIAAMAVALSMGVFETDVHRTTRAFEQAGIDPGTYEPAEHYLSHPSNHFQPLHADQLQSLVDRLSQAGAREVWVADIQRQDGQRVSHTLLLDLPPEASARRALFAALDSTQGLQRPRTPDIGQRFLRVDF